MTTINNNKNEEHSLENASTSDDVANIRIGISTKT